MRYIQVEKEWTLGFIAGDNGNEMYNAYENCRGLSWQEHILNQAKRLRSTITSMIRM